MKKFSIFYKFTILDKMLKTFSINPVYFIAPILLSFGAAFFEGLSAGLLIPLVKGVIQMDFRFVLDLPVARNIFASLTSTFGIKKFPVFAILISTIFVSSLMKNVMQYASSVMVAFQGRRLSYNLRVHIFKRYLSFGKLFFDNNNSGHLQNVLMGFTQRISYQLMMLQTFFCNILSLIIYTAIMLAVSLKLTIIVLIISPFLYFFLSRTIELIKKLSIDSADWEQHLGRKISNILSCIPLVKFYSQEKVETQKFNQISSVIRKLEFDVDKNQSLVSAIHDIAMLIVVLLLASVMMLMVLKQKLADVSSFLIYFYLLKKSSTAFGVINSVRSYLAAISGPLREVRKMLDDRDKPFVHDGTIAFEGLKDIIEFKNLNFSYKKTGPILKDVTFSIKKGKIVAIVGPTGSGKTTLINLIMRFYDCPESSIFVDGVDIRRFTSSSLTSNMAIVSQDTLLFDDTLRNNITYGAKKPVDDKTLNDILKKARIYDFVMKLPDGPDTQIGERGAQLSGGEKQRLALARAFLKDPQILILDEATSSLDTNTETLIQEAIDEIIKNRTAIVIAHKLSTIKNSDWIVVLEEGRVIETGTINGLLENKGKFFQYWEDQKFF